MQLNQQQQDAVTFVTGPCLVLAGAGSGKTRVITQKIAYLIQHCDYAARHIAAVTFTNKAAREMKERVGQTLGRQYTRGLTVSTFHTLGLTFIRKEYSRLGLKAGFSLFDDQDQLALLKELTEQELEGDKDLLRQLLTFISKQKNALYSPEHAQQRAQDAQEHLFAACYARYVMQMKAYNALDFDDLIALPVLLLKRDEDVRQRWQSRIRYLLIDEYQDTNTSQYEFIKLLIGARERFTVVGDDDQSIYAWRGADPQNLIRLQQDYSSLKVIKLEQNYRSTGRILRAANILIANNPHLFAKELFSNLAEGDKLQVLKAENEAHEAERVVGELLSHRFIHRTHYRDYAILYRGNFQSRLIEKSFIQNRIPYRLSGGTSFFARSEIKDLMAYLRVLVNPEDDNALLRIINVPRRDIGPVTLEKLGSYANSRGKSIFDVSSDMGLETMLSARQWRALQTFVQWMQSLQQQIAGNDGLQAIQRLMRELDYESWLYETSPSVKAAEMRMKNISELYQWVIADLEGDNAEQEVKPLKEIVQKLTLRDIMERNEADEDADQVQLMTLHASKGLEFPFVYLIGVEEGLLPHQTSIDENNIEEERRLMYVGITRAQRQLTMFMCKERQQYGEKVQPQPSRFLEELPQHDLEWESAPKPLSQAQRQEKGQNHIANIRAMLKQQ